MIVRKLSKFDPGKEQIQSLAKVVAYAITVNVFFFLCEVFVVFYSNIPEHMDHLTYLFVGLHGHGVPVPWMWASAVFAIIALILLIVPATRRREGILTLGCIAVVASTWIDKGFGLVIGGFIPNPFEKVFEYWPTFPEIMISVGVWAIGFFVLTVLYKITVSVKEEASS